MQWLCKRSTTLTLSIYNDLIAKALSCILPAKLRFCNNTKKRKLIFLTAVWHIGTNEHNYKKHCVYTLIFNIVLKRGDGTRWLCAAQNKYVSYFKRSLKKDFYQPFAKPPGGAVAIDSSVPNTAFKRFTDKLTRVRVVGSVAVELVSLTAGQK